MKIADVELEYLNEMRMLSTDEHGRTIFVGLTLAESEEYYALVSQGHEGRHSDDSERYIELHDKHELARLQVIHAEAELRGNPTRN
jgi:hypothetical protein